MRSTSVPVVSPSEAVGLVDGLAQLSFLVQGELARASGAHGLTVAQIRLLGILRDREPGINQLARALDLDKSSVTGLVDRAEKRGLVERSASTEDRRAVHVVLTNAGRRLGSAVSREFDDAIADIVGDLADEDREALTALVSRVVLARQATQGLLP